MKQEIKVFEVTTTLKDCFLECIKEGYRPATSKEIMEFAKQKQIDIQRYYDSSTFYFPETGEFEDVNIKEIKKIIEKRISARPMYVISGSVVGRSYGLGDNEGRLVGIKKVNV